MRRLEVTDDAAVVAASPDRQEVTLVAEPADLRPQQLALPKVLSMRRAQPAVLAPTLDLEST